MPPTPPELDTLYDKVARIKTNLQDLVHDLIEVLETLKGWD